ncbi:hypothetical protein [Acidianus sp. HS-5]|uniref:hypothetical protein n=1 Tax=Acidianus sp. HS-5 TaxID=2886040 RepID=UPI001F3D490A|nr:hypothetical protein [Acidianus sp. HS-5]BDC17758.1 hypothetical protein HS5_06480 [Acidianus sp. HS-5]
MKGISDFVAFLIILVIIVVILIPLAFYLLNPYYQSQSCSTQNPQIINDGIITITYTSSDNGGILNVSYTAIEPEVLHIYNYSNGIWVNAKYSPFEPCKHFSHCIIYKLCGYAQEVNVELNIAGKIYYVTVSYGSTAKVT